MPVRHASQCCRALRHPVVSAAAAVTKDSYAWITDSVLDHAFNRYCIVSKQARRSASQVPGPLESRRRIGKRRMGGLYAHGPAPQVSPLDFQSVDMSNWRWQPANVASTRERSLPKTPESDPAPLQEAPRVEEVSAPLGSQTTVRENAQPSWEAPAVDEVASPLPSLTNELTSQPPCQGTEASHPQTGGRAVSTTKAQEGGQPTPETADSVLSPTPQACPVQQASHTERLDVDASASSRSDTKTATSERLNVFCDSAAEMPIETAKAGFQQLVKELDAQIQWRRIQHFEVARVYEKLAHVLDKAFKDSSLAMDLHYDLCLAIARNFWQDWPIDPPFWNSMFSRLSTHPMDEGVCTIVNRLLKICSTRSDSFLIADGMLAVTRSILSAWATNANSHYAARARSAEETAAAAIERLSWRISKVGQVSNISLAKRHLELAWEILDDGLAAWQEFRTAVISANCQLGTLGELFRAAEAQPQKNFVRKALGKQVTTSAETKRYMMVNWLLMLAASPTVGFGSLLQGLTNKYFETEKLANQELCLLLLTKWDSLQLLRNPTLWEYCSGVHGESDVLALLSCAIYDGEVDPNRRTVMKQLCRALTKLQRWRDVEEAFASKPQDVAHEVCVFTLQCLADFSNDFGVAERLRQVYERTWQRPGDRAWGLRTEVRYLRQLVVSNPTLFLRAFSPANEISLADDTAAIWNMKALQRKRFWQIRVAEVGWRKLLVSRAALRFAGSEELSPRHSRRLVQKCIQYIRLHHQTPGARTGQFPVQAAIARTSFETVLRAYFHVVTRDLREGRPGHTRLFLRLVRLAQMSAGIDEAQKLRVSLWAWRADNMKQLKMGGQ